DGVAPAEHADLHFELDDAAVDLLIISVEVGISGLGPFGCDIGVDRKGREGLGRKFVIVDDAVDKLIAKLTWFHACSPGMGRNPAAHYAGERRVALKVRGLGGDADEAVDIVEDQSPLAAV